MDVPAAITVVILADAFAEAMGYAGSRIPASLAKKPGVSVHLVTAGIPVYAQMTDFQKTYAGIQKKGYPAGTVRDVDGFKVHYVDYIDAYGGVRMTGLGAKLAELKPDIVQVFSHTGWLPIDAARFQRKLGYKLFTGNHTTASVYPLATDPKPIFHPARLKELVRRGLPGRFISSRMELCYGATVDCSDVARRFFGVPAHKLKTVPLGVDTDIFHPAANDDERSAASALRRSLGVGDDEIMCVYTGRFAVDKNPLLMAQAVAAMRERGEPYRAVFYGDGTQRDEIAAVPGTIVNPFVHFSELGNVFRAADIGVWPTQESTSMIDCAASGTPIVVNDQLAAVERVRGNGLQYRLNDIDDLQAKLLELKDPARRAELGAFGARKMEDQFSWNALVQIRLDDYRKALGLT
ncbi:glycosyltransferase family 4 protein [Sphingomonas sp.]|uniref:glycosyltransferase family 4 protein n=1 Tax=Sphingomonas sp. TaxID=28214 RepID=UPI001E16C7D7|nr:glycosyltransferase family 4 protein [Sphingomonas sp.]MBX9795994.1 glycosyltransferase family 4 protein [Sphingomonas sp.]